MMLRCISACLLFLFSLAGGQVVPSEVEQMMRELGNIVEVTSFLDTQECYDALMEADVNNDRRVTADEYVTVVQIMGPPGFLENVTDFSDLPFRIKTTFNALACLCTRSGGASDCCIGDNAHISNEGAAPGETPTSEQSAYLFTVCLATIRSINAVLEPSSAPSLAPSMRLAPPQGPPRRRRGRLGAARELGLLPDRPEPHRASGRHRAGIAAGWGAAPGLSPRSARALRRHACPRRGRRQPAPEVAALPASAVGMNIRIRPASSVIARSNAASRSASEPSTSTGSSMPQWSVSEPPGEHRHVAHARSHTVMT